MENDQTGEATDETGTRLEHVVSVVPFAKMDGPDGRRGKCSCGWLGGMDSEKGARWAAENHKYSSENPPVPRDYTAAERSDDNVLQALRRCSHILDEAACRASGVGDFAWANRLWSMQSLIDVQRKDARTDGKRFLGQLPGSSKAHGGQGPDPAGSQQVPE